MHLSTQSPWLPRHQFSNLGTKLTVIERSGLFFAESSMASTVPLCSTKEQRNWMKFPRNTDLWNTASAPELFWASAIGMTQIWVNKSQGTFERQELTESKYEVKSWTSSSGLKCFSIVRKTRRMPAAADQLASFSFCFNESTKLDEPQVKSSAPIGQGAEPNVSLMVIAKFKQAHKEWINAPQLLPYTIFIAKDETWKT